MGAPELRIPAERVEDLAVPGHAVVAVGFAEWGRPTVLLTAEADAEVPVERTGHGTTPRRRAVRPYPATVVRPDGVAVDIGPIDTAFPQIQALPDGGWVIVGRRCRRGDQNAAVHGPDGAVLRRFAAADAIEWVQATRDGSLWVGYFDEAFGQDPIADGGLVRFGCDGAVTYRYDPPSGMDTIVDCYALNASDDATWACAYPDFPLVRVRPDGSVRVWKEGVSGATALAVFDGRVLLHGGYGEASQDVHLARLGDVALVGRRSVRIVDDEGRRLRPDRVEGRGRHLHLLRGTTWWRVDLATVPA